MVVGNFLLSYDASNEQFAGEINHGFRHWGASYMGGCHSSIGVVDWLHSHRLSGYTTEKKYSRSDTRPTICTLYGNIKTVHGKPHLYSYFYNAKAYSKLDDNRENLREEIDIMSEAIFGIIEHACLQKQNLPHDSWNNCWQPYAHERMRKSAEMEKFIDPNQAWYTDSLRKVVKEFYSMAAF